MLERIPYDRRAAVAYAHQWAYGRNPDFYDYEEIGGDCTNFASQCLYAGTGVMNFNPVYGWFYRDPNDKAPAWTGVEYFFDFITRQTPSPGPFGISTTLSELEPGDFVQFRFNKDVFGHTPVVVEIGRPATLQNTLIAAHSYDADWRPPIIFRRSASCTYRAPTGNSVRNRFFPACKNRSPVHLWTGEFFRRV